MKNLMKTKVNKKGFTLAELLIVVAIIAVLVAISIPIFTSQLEKSRDATDEANVRSAIAEVTAAVLSDDKTDSGDVTYSKKDDGDGTYTMTVKAKGQKAGWSGAASTTESIKIGGIEVKPSTKGWTVSGTSEGDKIKVEEDK
ncbi:prepilin-type N-terminal cleavage/methylation domain-containing protein [Eubacterium pyruvativorans]|uniref:Prepilin-type N-terminal cleavage/methylation domain-containing protein n=2 Tax=Eubacterium pyruvativorans TaxID=155865 RepID=A0A1I7G1M5_9FIRM|nr:prepilin-type N-terminal cleavage/methylation domain-containing protein [Eubacterium pyruvativorans]SFU42370.1 prepilin-type N-terminal cleavage/methylation domain-containing protein [Eubacterium pyruvativorans]